MEKHSNSGTFRRYKTRQSSYLKCSLQQPQISHLFECLCLLLIYKTNKLTKELQNNATQQHTINPPRRHHDFENREQPKATITSKMQPNQEIQQEHTIISPPLPPPKKMAHDKHVLKASKVECVIYFSSLTSNKVPESKLYCPLRKRSRMLSMSDCKLSR